LGLLTQPDVRSLFHSPAAASPRRSRAHHLMTEPRDLAFSIGFDDLVAIVLGHIKSRHRLRIP
jgi:hypothetical protein